MRKEDKPLAAKVLRGLLDYRKAQTMKSIYERIEPSPRDGRIRCSMNPAGTETGRLSHSDTWLEKSTNLANLPNKTAAKDEVYRVRECLVADAGRLIWKADYNAAEARWCAYIANDIDRIRLYNQGVDQYKLFVAVLKYEDTSKTDIISKAERNAIGKVGILSGQYGVGWKTVLDTVNADTPLTGVAINAKTAKKMVGIWPDLFPLTVAWWGRVEEEILSKGYLTNPFGRRRDFFGRMDSNYARASVVREGIAYGPQSANADKIAESLITLYEECDPDPLRLLLQVHDENVGDCAVNDIHEVKRQVVRVMERPTKVGEYDVVIPAEFSAGMTWATCGPV